MRGFTRFAETERKAWAALQSKATPEGDLHGFGSYLLAGAEIVRLQSENQR
jgi:hypothetical protein